MVSTEKDIPRLTNNLSSSDRSIRRGTVVSLLVLARKGFDISEAIPKLTQCILSSDQSFRRNAIWVLDEATKNSSYTVNVITTLINCLGDGDQFVRRKAAFILAKIAEKGIEDLAKIRKALQESAEKQNKKERLDTLEYLKQITEGTRKGKQRLEGQLSIGKPKRPVGRKGLVRVQRASLA